MYSILVVDDSAAERDCVSFLIRKNSLPLAVESACNGSEALDLLRGQRFDILLTDVKMPFLDGLALSRAALELCPDQKIIIFSGYHEFDYAKTAIGLGVKDYLLKPLDPGEFLPVMKKVMEELDERRRALSLEERHREYVQNHLLLRLLSSLPAEAPDGGASTPVSLDFLSGYCRLVLLESHSEFFSGQGLRLEDYLRRRLHLPFDYLNVSPNQSVLLLKKPEGAVEDDWLRSRLPILSGMIGADFGETVYMAFGGQVTPSTIGPGYRELEERMELRFFFPGQQVFYPGLELTGTLSHNNPISLELIEADLQLRDYLRLREHLEYLFAGLRDTPCYSELYIKFFFSSVAKDIFELLPEGRAGSLESVIEEIYRGDSIRQLEQVVLGAVTLLEELVPPLTTHASRTEAVKQYIYRNYRGT